MQTQPVRIYRLRPYYRNVAIAGMAFFLLIGAGSAFAAFFNVDGSFPRPIAAGITSLVFWGAWVLLGLYLLLAYFRYRLSIGQERIVETGVFRMKRTEISAIGQVKWTQKAPAGGVVLTSSRAKIRIELNSFTRDEREDIITFLRECVPKTLHVNWDEFQEHFSEKRPERAPVRRGLRLVMAALLFGMAATFFVIWLQTKEPRFLTTAAMNLGLGGFLVWVEWLMARKHSAERAPDRLGES